MVEILSKDGRMNIQEKSAQTGPQKFYFGAGWDIANGATDLDLCVGIYAGTTVKDFVYYAQKKSAGVTLSEDNRSGAGDGDDEFCVIDTATLPADVDGLVISFAVYEGLDFCNVANPHIRWCDGGTANSPELGKFPIKDSAFDGDTLLRVVTIKKTPAGWTLKADGTFSAVGKGVSAIKAASEFRV